MTTHRLVLLLSTVAMYLGACTVDSDGNMDFDPGAINNNGNSGIAGQGSNGVWSNGDGLPPCTTKASQVVILGDSYINWASHTLPADLARLSGETWRLYAVGGFSMGSGGIGLIPPQFDAALADDPDIKVVVMDGGGNDILIPAITWEGGSDCKNNPDAADVQVCRDIIDFAIESARDLIARAAEAGVKDVVYFFYPRVPEGTLIGGLYPNAMLAYALPLARSACAEAFTRTNGQLRCHFVDMVPVFDGHPEYFAPADIHPSAQGSDAMAQAIWNKMLDECLAQPVSSGCCVP